MSHVTYFVAMGLTVGTFLVTELFSAAVASTVIVGTLTVGGLVGGLVIAGGLIALQFALAPKVNTDVPKPESGSQALRQSIPPRIFGYGTVRLAGYYVFYEVDAEERSIDILAFHSGKIQGIRGFRLHDDTVVIDADGRIIDAIPRDGRYADIAGVLTNAVQILFRLGAPMELSYGDIMGIWSHDLHRGDGVASVMLICNSPSGDDFQKVYPHQHPELSVIADGLAVWDPREAGQSPDDSTTWAASYPSYNAGTTYAARARVRFTPVFGDGALYYSRLTGNTGHDPDSEPTWWCRVDTNPVLQLINYLTDQDHGMGLDRSALIDPVIAALMVEANLCDDLISNDDVLTEARYRSNGWSTFDTDPANVIGSILATCDGWIGETFDGELALKVGVYRAPSLAITDDHITGFSVADGIPDEEAVNELLLTYTSPDNNYKTMDGPPLQLEEIIAATGKRRTQTLALTWVQSYTQAQRLQQRAMDRLQSTFRGTFTTTSYGLRVLGERWIRVQTSMVPGLENAVVEIQPGGKIDLGNGKVTLQWILIDPVTIDNPGAVSAPPTVPDLPDAAELVVPQNLGGEAVGDPPFHLDIFFDDPVRPDLSYRARYRLVDAGSGLPGDWTVQDFTSPTITGGKVYMTLYPLTTAPYEVEAATVGAGGSRSNWSSSIILALVTPSLDFSLPQNNQYVPALF